MKRVILLVIFVGIGVFEASAQETARIKGQVVDDLDQPFEGAIIRIESTDLEVGRREVSEASGVYTFDNLPPGNYALTVSYIGYVSETVRGVRVQAGGVVVQDFVLTPVTIVQDRVIVSASRKEEKILTAPASVMVVDAGDLIDRPNLSVVTPLRHTPSVDYVQTGLTTTNVVTRGFNNVASGALLSFVDNRISRIPSLRFNTHNFIPLAPDDVDRIELVLGPGSALYGPNSGSGVMHIITRSPFDSEGTTLYSGGGERGLRAFSARHARVLSDRIAIKVSGNYYSGREWEYEDPEEVRLRGFNPRDYDIERRGGDIRLDLKPMDEGSLTLSAGHTRSDNLEMTTLGTALAKGWTYNYLQGRFRYRDLFAQVYINRSNSGDTELLRSGQPVVDRSTLTVAQLQHAISMGNGRQRFTYGSDVLLTGPETGGTISGAYEDQDGIEVAGIYVQSETVLGPNADLVLAGRWDTHNHLPDPVLSPRAALVFKSPDQTLRLTYNRSFGTPSSTNLFLDIVSSQDPFGVGIDLRAQGTFQGFTFPDQNGQPLYRSPFAALGGLESSTYIPLDDPQFTNVLWNVGREAVLESYTPTFSQLASDVAPGNVDALLADFEQFIPTTITGVENDLRTLSTETGGFLDIPDSLVSNIPQLKPSIVETYEVGYKAVIGNKLLVTADVFRDHRTNFVGQFNVETPNVFLDAASLETALETRFRTALADPTNAELALVVGRLDDRDRGGNESGSAADELSQIFVEGADNDGAAYIPFGTVSPEQATDPTAVILTYRNFGGISIYGIDLNFVYYASEDWVIDASYSYLSENVFPTRAVNAPMDKFHVGSRYHHSQTGIGFGGHLRYRGAYPMSSGVFAGDVESFTVIDLDVSYDLPLYSPDATATLSLNVSNLFDNMHREFIGAPEIGRMIAAGLTVRF
jgi:outer membrane receptor for ferrienterochelin and colicins